MSCKKGNLENEYNHITWSVDTFLTTTSNMNLTDCFLLFLVEQAPIQNTTTGFDSLYQYYHKILLVIILLITKIVVVLLLLPWKYEHYGLLSAFLERARRHSVAITVLWLRRQI